MNGTSPISAAVHVHSDWSYDGQWSLPRLADAFARRGCRVLLMSEHDRGFDAVRWRDYRQACAAASSEQILIVPGIEYSDSTNTLHVLTWGEAPFLSENLATDALLDQATEAGLFTVLAHPTRKNAWRHFDPEWVGKLRAVEVWNRKSDGFAPSRDAWRLVHEHSLLPFVGLDFHRKNQFFPAVMQLHGLAEVTQAQVYDALHQGRVTGKVLGINANRFEQGMCASITHTAEAARQTARRFLAPLRDRRKTDSASRADDATANR